MYSKLTTDNIAKDLARKYFVLSLLQKAWQLELKAEDWKRLKNSAKELRIKIDNSPVFEFYGLAKLRDNVLASNIFESVKNRPDSLIIVIAGGFHSNAITAILKEKGVLYRVLAPGLKFNKDQTAGVAADLNIYSTLSLSPDLPSLTPLRDYHPDSAIQRNRIPASTGMTSEGKSITVAQDTLRPYENLADSILQSKLGALFAAYKILKSDDKDKALSNLRRWIAENYSKKKNGIQNISYIKRGNEYVVSMDIKDATAFQARLKNGSLFLEAHAGLERFNSPIKVKIGWLLWVGNLILDWFRPLKASLRIDSAGSITILKSNLPNSHLDTLQDAFQQVYKSVSVDDREAIQNKSIAIRLNRALTFLGGIRHGFFSRFIVENNISLSIKLFQATDKNPEEALQSVLALTLRHELEHYLHKDRPEGAVRLNDSTYFKNLPVSSQSDILHIYSPANKNNIDAGKFYDIYLSKLSRNEIVTELAYVMNKYVVKLGLVLPAEELGELIAEDMQNGGVKLHELVPNYESIIVDRNALRLLIKWGRKNLAMTIDVKAGNIRFEEPEIALEHLVSAKWELKAGTVQEINDLLRHWETVGGVKARELLVKKPERTESPIDLSHNVIMVTDIGYDSDDAMALALILASQEINLLGVVTTGEPDVPVAVHDRAKLAQKMLVAAGRTDVPVYSEEPPSMSGFERNELLGPSLLLSHLEKDIDPEELGIRTSGGVRFIVDAVRAKKGNVTLLSIGPTDIIARTIREGNKIDADFSKKLTILAMGGNLDPERLMSDKPEYNFRNYPAATKAVLESGANIVLVPSDLTWKVPVTAEQALEFQESGSELLKILGLQIEKWIEYLIAHLGVKSRAKGSTKPAGFMHDPLAVYVLLSPESFRWTRLDMKFDAGSAIADPVWQAESRVLVAVQMPKEKRSHFFNNFVERVQQAPFGRLSSPVRVRAAFWSVAWPFLWLRDIVRPVKYTIELKGADGLLDTNATTFSKVFTPGLTYHQVEAQKQALLTAFSNLYATLTPDARNTLLTTPIDIDIKYGARRLGWVTGVGGTLNRFISRIKRMLLDIGWVKSASVLDRMFKRQKTIILHYKHFEVDRYNTREVLQEVLQLTLRHELDHFIYPEMGEKLIQMRDWGYFQRLPDEKRSFILHVFSSRNPNGIDVYHYDDFLTEKFIHAPEIIMEMYGFFKNADLYQSWIQELASAREVSKNDIESALLLARPELADRYFIMPEELWIYMLPLLAYARKNNYQPLFIEKGGLVLSRNWKLLGKKFKDWGVEGIPAQPGLIKVKRPRVNFEYLENNIKPMDIGRQINIMLTQDERQAVIEEKTLSLLQEKFENLSMEDKNKIDQHLANQGINNFAELIARSRSEGVNRAILVSYLADAGVDERLVRHILRLQRSLDIVMELTQQPVLSIEMVRYALENDEIVKEHGFFSNEELEIISRELNKAPHKPGHVIEPSNYRILFAIVSQAIGRMGGNIKGNVKHAARPLLNILLEHTEKAGILTLPEQAAGWLVIDETVATMSTLILTEVVAKSFVPVFEYKFGVVTLMVSGMDRDFKGRPIVDYVAHSGGLVVPEHQPEYLPGMYLPHVDAATAGELLKFYDYTVLKQEPALKIREVMDAQLFEASDLLQFKMHSESGNMDDLKRVGYALLSQYEIRIKEIILEKSELAEQFKQSSYIRRYHLKRLPFDIDVEIVKYALREDDPRAAAFSESLVTNYLIDYSIGKRGRTLFKKEVKALINKIKDNLGAPLSDTWYYQVDKLLRVFDELRFVDRLGSEHDAIVEREKIGVASLDKQETKKIVMQYLENPTNKLFQKLREVATNNLPAPEFTVKEDGGSGFSGSASSPLGIALFLGAGTLYLLLGNWWNGSTEINMPFMGLILAPGISAAFVKKALQTVLEIASGFFKRKAPHVKIGDEGLFVLENPAAEWSTQQNWMWQSIDYANSTKIKESLKEIAKDMEDAVAKVFSKQGIKSNTIKWIGLGGNYIWNDGIDYTYKEKLMDIAVIADGDISNMAPFEIQVNPQTILPPGIGLPDKVRITVAGENYLLRNIDSKKRNDFLLWAKGSLAPPNGKLLNIDLDDIPSHDLLNYAKKVLEKAIGALNNGNTYYGFDLIKETQAALRFIQGFPGKLNETDQIPSPADIVNKLKTDIKNKMLRTEYLENVTRSMEKLIEDGKEGNIIEEPKALLIDFDALYKDIVLDTSGKVLATTPREIERFFNLIKTWNEKLLKEEKRGVLHLVFVSGQDLDISDSNVLSADVVMRKMLLNYLPENLLDNKLMWDASKLRSIGAQSQDGRIVLAPLYEAIRDSIKTQFKLVGLISDKDDRWDSDSLSREDLRSLLYIIAGDLSQLALGAAMSSQALDGQMSRAMEQFMRKTYGSQAAEEMLRQIKIGGRIILPNVPGMPKLETFQTRRVFNLQA